MAIEHTIQGETIMNFITKTLATASLAIAVSTGATALLGSAAVIGTTVAMTAVTATQAEAGPRRFSGRRGVTTASLGSGR